MRFRILDLETVGLPEAVEWVDPLSAPANYKDPLKIAAYIKEAEAERVDRFALDADTCRIVALGWHDVGYGDPEVELFKTEDQERAGLIRFFTSYQQQFTKLVTFNGARFDLPVLLMRAIYLDVEAPEIVIRPEWKSPHIDLWETLSVQGARRDVKSLRFYAKRLGIGTLDRVDGSQIAGLVKAGDWLAVESHCRSDLALTRFLAQKLRLIPSVEPVAA